LANKVFPHRRWPPGIPPRLSPGPLDRESCLLRARLRPGSSPRRARGCTPERWGLAPRHRLIAAKPKQDGARQAQSSVEVQGGRYAGAPRSLPCDQYLLPHVASSGGEGTLDLRSGYRHRAGGGPVSLGNRSTEIPGVNCPRFRACARTSASQSYGARFPTYHRGMLFHVHIPFSVFLVSIGKFSDLCHQTHFGL